MVNGQILVQCCNRQWTQVTDKVDGEISVYTCVSANEEYLQQFDLSLIWFTKMCNAIVAEYFQCYVYMRVTIC